MCVREPQEMDGEPVNVSETEIDSDSSGSNWSENEGMKRIRGRKRKMKLRTLKNKEHIESVHPVRRRGHSKRPSTLNIKLQTQQFHRSGTLKTGGSFVHA